ncbi:MAG: glycosyltransferase family 4 protein, partial [Acutalibacteraceae bacterium]
KYRNANRWFSFSKEIRHIYSYEGICENSVPDADIVIATAVRTVKGVENLSSKKGKKVYFIQDFENWSCPDEYVYSTYRLGMKNIVVSSRLKEMVDSYCENESVKIFNGIDENQFFISSMPEDRKENRVAMLCHKMEHKGTRYGLEAIKRVAETMPDLKVELFGTSKFHIDLPCEYNFTLCATTEKLREIYNSSKVFIQPTVKEGFGLTSIEAMACGAALATTDFDTMQDYAIDNETALVSPVKNPEALGDNVIKLLCDDELRVRIAKSGEKYVRKFSFDNSYRLFEKTLLDLL